MNALKSLGSLIKNRISVLQDPDSYVPPQELITAVGAGGADAFLAVGREFFDHFVKLGGLRPTDRVLDVGCGCGRLAVPLLTYLTEPGEYLGFDIVRPGIRWARRRITSRHPCFHFDAIDVCNKHYNPKGKTPPGKYRFPYADGFFDFTFLTSVFTHMLAPDMRQYLGEIARTLKPGGKCFATYFILTAESRELISQGKGGHKFPHAFPDCWVTSADTPEAAVAFDEGFIRQSFSDFGLSIVEPIHFGQWCGRKPFVSYQDIIIATKI